MSKLQYCKILCNGINNYAIPKDTIQLYAVPCDEWNDMHILLQNWKFLAIEAIQRTDKQPNGHLMEN